EELAVAESFYREILGFRAGEAFIDTGTGARGRVMEHHSASGAVIELLLVPFDRERLPNPQHIAFETQSEALHTAIFDRAKAAGMHVRAVAALHSKKTGMGELTVRGRSYRNFYLLDPSSGTNIEVMWATGAASATG